MWLKRALMMGLLLVSLTGLAAGQEGSQAPVWRATVKSANVPLYAGLAESSRTISLLPAGEVVAISLEISTSDGRWYRISPLSQPEQQGYVNGRDLLVEAPPQVAVWEYKPPEPEPPPAQPAAAVKPNFRGVIFSQGKGPQDIKGFFSSTFGRSLPVSAFGQTSLHSHMGFDHRNAVDVALSPDSAMGRALMSSLRSKGVPFIAFRHAIPGIATGAHIHVGKPSRRARARHR